MVEHLNYNLNVKGSNPTTRNGREKMVKISAIEVAIVIQLLPQSFWSFSTTSGVWVNQRNCFLPNVCGFLLPARLQWVEPPGGGMGSGNPQTFGGKQFH